MANSTVQSPGNLAAVMKSTWTSDRLEKAFMNQTAFLDKVENIGSRYTIGDYALVPLHTGRSGGSSVMDAEGGSLNNPTRQKTKKGQYGISYNWKQIGIETGALNQAKGNTQSVADALDLEVTGGIDDLRFQVERQVASNGDGLIAQLAANSSTTTLNLQTLANGGYGWDVLSRGFLYPDLEIDIGTTSNPTAIASDVTIQTVDEGAADGSTPVITISGSNVTTTTSHYISIHGARNADGSSKEMNGLRNLFGSATTTVGGINPATDAYWKPAYVDTTTTTLTLDLLLKLQLKVFQKTGKWPKDLLTSAQQVTNYWSILQNQTRYAGDGGLDSGNVDSAKWRGITPWAVPSLADRELYMGDLSTLGRVTGAYTKPTWVSDIEGTTRGLNWVQGTTRFQDAIFYALNLITRNRSAWASAVNFTA